MIPEKSEHEEHDVHSLPKDVWRADFHSIDDPRHHYDHSIDEFDGEDHSYNHHYESGENEIDEEDNGKGMLTPKTPEKDDPRLKIPSGKSTASHDHVIVPKEPVPTDEHRPRYGQAYEHDRKEAMRGSGESAGLAPKQPIKERINREMITEVHHLHHRQPCSAYGSTNRCQGMTCEVDEDCASHCCGQLTEGGEHLCHNLIEGSFCPRALAPLVDYSAYIEEYEGDHMRRNDILGTLPASNDIPTYRGQDGCKVHGTEDQCDGQPCVDDGDCHSGCCGHFVSFSLRRCLPLTEDSLCPRVLEPSFTSPIPARLPPIESTIRDMYSI